MNSKDLDKAGTKLLEVSDKLRIAYSKEPNSNKKSFGMVFLWILGILILIVGLIAFLGGAFAILLPLAVIIALLYYPIYKNNKKNRIWEETK